MHRSSRSLLLAGLAAAGLAAPRATADLDLPPYEPDATAERSAIPDVYKWDLSALFASDDAWKAEADALEQQIPALADFQGSLSDPARLQACLERYFQLHDRANRVNLYAQLRQVTALSDDGLQAMVSRGARIMDQLMQTAGFIRSEVLALSDKQVERAFRKARGGLDPYRHYIENLRRRKAHLLGPEAEKVLAMAGDNLWAEIDLNEIKSPAERTFEGLLTDIPWPTIRDEQGQEVQLTLANYGKYRSSPVREVRRAAVEALLGTLHQYRHAFASTLAAQYQLDVLYARARGYDTALEAYLDKDDIDPAVYSNLIDTIHAHLEPLHRYVELRKKAMGLEDLHLYDLYVPLVPGVEHPITYAEARELALEALAPLGEDYLSVVSKGMDPHEGWVDVYPSRDKESGAFCAGVYGTHPYVMLNFQNQLDDAFTLIHEFGHAMHTWLAMQNQGYPDFRYVPFIAEIASTANESLLMDHLLAQVQDPHERAYLLTERLEKIRTTIYRQALFAEFEWKVHQFVEQGTPVTADLLEQTYAELIRQYYGPGYTLDEHDGMEWAYVPHFYYKYYVFTYATGLSSGIALAERVKDGDPEKVSAYLGMLKGGCSRPPLELLKGAGVDLTRPDAIVAALEQFDQTLAELDGLLDQLGQEAPAGEQGAGEAGEG